MPPALLIQANKILNYWVAHLPARGLWQRQQATPIFSRRSAAIRLGKERGLIELAAN